MNKAIKEITVFRRQIPLVSPYVLSFTTVKEIVTFVTVVKLEDDSEGIGESVPLPGYSEDTEQSILSTLGNALELADLHDTSSFLEKCRALPDSSAFAISSLSTAVEHAIEMIDRPRKLKIPLLAPLSSTINKRQLLENSRNLREAGFTVLKLKVGTDIFKDMESVECILSNVVDDSFKLRIDANQGYSFAEASQLFALVSESRNLQHIECVEQPLSIDNWTEHALLMKLFPNVPLMLDESIFNSKDIERAAEIGAKLVKLKLFKHAGLTEVKKLADYASTLDLEVVIGNGVSTDIGNLFEAFAYTRSKFLGASEGNGFCKIEAKCLENPPELQHGFLVWESKECSCNPIQLSTEFFANASKVLSYSRQ